MTKESICNHTKSFDLTAREIEHLYWFLKCHEAPLYTITRSYDNGIGPATDIEVWGKEETRLNITDYSTW